jgi:hypothetical protein
MASDQLEQKALQECCCSAQRSLTSIYAAMKSGLQGQRALRECWRSVKPWLTSISTTMTSTMLGQRALQECWRSAQRWPTSISATIRSDQLEQKGSQECWRSAQRWLTSISATIRSDEPGKGGFDLRGAVKPLAFVCRHLALLDLCHLFTRQATTKRDILHTYSVVAFGLAHSL